jgi:hypothetical protein
VVAVVDDRASAEHAVQALRNAGLPEHDIDLLDGPSVVATSRSYDQQHGILGRLASWLSSVLSDDSSYIRDYVLEAESGHYFVIVHAPQQDLVERVREVLHAHGAHSMRHYEWLTVTDL